MTKVDNTEICDKLDPSEYTLVSYTRVVYPYILNLKFLQLTNSKYKISQRNKQISFENHDIDAICLQKNPNPDQLSNEYRILTLTAFVYAKELCSICSPEDSHAHFFVSLGAQK